MRQYENERQCANERPDLYKMRDETMQMRDQGKSEDSGHEEALPPPVHLVTPIHLRDHDGHYDHNDAQ